MGWISRVKDIIDRLRESGKSEDEVKEIVMQESDKATVAVAFGMPEVLLTTQECVQQYEYFASAAGEGMRRLADEIRNAMEQAAAAFRMTHGIRQKESNNWRKMHGLPMRRKGRRR